MQIHETAFIVSHYRAQFENISKDPYAKLWHNPKTAALLPDILDNVSPHEAIMHCVRNRFFFEQLHDFFKKHTKGTLINFGSGFSMYQYMLPDHVLTIEIDKESILQFKERKIVEWTQKNKLPQRTTKYISLDFNLQPQEEIVSKISSLLDNQPNFILLEGVLFFLSPATRDKIFAVFKALQKSGDLIGSVSYLPEVENTAVYQRLLDYFNANNDLNDSFMHQTTPLSFYENLKDYTILQQSSELETLATFAPTHDAPEPSECLNESLYILRKN
ncbi:class I SAM-dependent methyltransferase [Aquimarina brevivitae]|uniref:Leucine carboxyl methyltransferase n=1 Tax=Aquimarina brevivitae TaxID=323412 RepID=A0A4Q7PM99_9FLAO|nr:class I SAM-dependent methyltransferase [Aquimarina brevivitae]RZT00123.1 leucine carboxyl methyltransferase [Aquimarina brevivitae]